MTVTDIVQVVTLFICAATIPIWWFIGARNARLRYLRWVVILPSAITVLFYLVVLLTDWNELNPASAALVSALIRLYTRALLLVGGVVMLRFYTRRTGGRG